VEAEYYKIILKRLMELRDRCRYADSLEESSVLDFNTNFTAEDIDEENFVVTKAYLYYLVRNCMNSILLLYKGHHYFIEPNAIDKKRPDYFVGHIEHYEDDMVHYIYRFTDLLNYKVHDGRLLGDVLEETEMLE